jgi:hypothetical protein
MASHAGLNQPGAVALLKVRVPYNRAETEERAREIVERYAYSGQVVFSTLDDTDLDRVAWVVTLLLMDWMRSVDSFRTYTVDYQVNRFLSGGYPVSEITVYTPEA